ncbi:MAG: hypothetical protein KC449_26320 [Anaerolineales bacterium]|nr:hypothetical protein [Anaerolineales bacterium]MCB8948082.1 hypothetical protein [Ardenticatenaceae bacterium]
MAGFAIQQRALFKWLAVAAVVEWLLVRTFTRAAIHIPKSSFMISLYAAVNQIGLVAAAFVALLAFVLLLWLAWQTRQAIILPLMLLGLVLLSVLFLVIVPPVWLAVAYQLLAISAVILIASYGVRTRWVAPEKKKGRWGTAMVLFPACALLAGLLVQLLPNLYALLGWPGPPPITTVLFNLGELFVVASVIIWWWESRSLDGHTHSWKPWLLAAFPALLFALSFWRDPAMTGILTIWSTGLTLFLPWLVYVLALWLAGGMVLADWHTRPNFAYAILLLASAGYAPQLSSQLFCALIGLWLLQLPLSRNQPVQRRLPERQSVESPGTFGKLEKTPTG